MPDTSPTVPSDVSPVPPQAASTTTKAVVGGTIGNFVEWFDWSVYGFFATYFAGQFFPGDGAVLATLLVFAISFFMRPVGAAVLGVYADRQGRKHGMTLTILLMAGGSLLIAVAPTYGTVGWLAPTVLVVGRLLQGFSTGGEFGTSASFLVEWARPGRKAFAGSFQQVSVVLGILCASLAATVLTRTLTESQMTAWGWRVPFLLGALIGLVGLYIRRSLSEPEAFTEMSASGRTVARPLGAMSKGHRRGAAIIFGVSIAGSVITYMWLTYLPTYANLTAGTDLGQAQLANTVTLAVFVCLLPVAGLLSDRYGRRPTMLVYATAFVVLPFPLLSLLGPGFGSVLLVSLVGVVFLSLNHSNLATVFAEMFPPQVRTIGIALPYAISNALFGGTAPSVMQFFGSRDILWVVPLYVSVCSLATAVTIYLMPETRDIDTRDAERVA